ncbi:hypothetical protein EUGRSUZ_K03329 [Eucalyptus grandis]|uniref:Uncharacterized protein n=2 Tax=Eucalyptus grandis TaxID=71139 RepID=A0ACC3J0V4_EUCGR|nr:hypothetical protein EUGRSUZ_K03329 [Eucalyptus grandis]
MSSHEPSILFFKCYIQSRFISFLRLNFSSGILSECIRVHLIRKISPNINGIICYLLCRRFFEKTKLNQTDKEIH